MARALEEFYIDVLAELGVVGIDRGASAEDLAVVTSSYPGVWHLLDSLGLTSWILTADIPDDVTLPLRWIVAYYIAGQFGIGGAKMERLAANGVVGGPMPSLGERMLRRLASPDYIPSTIETTYY